MPAGVLHILIGVEIGDVRHTHDDAVGHAVVAQEPLQVIEHTPVVLARVALVDIGVDILDVDDVFMNEWQEALKVLTVNIESPAQRVDLNIPKGCYILKVGKVVRKVQVR